MSRGSRQRAAAQGPFRVVLADMIERAELTAREVAARFGISEDELNAWLSGEVIPPHVVRVGARQLLAMRIATMARHWTPAEDALLGTDTDATVARRIGRTPVAVMLRRRNRGIPAAMAARGRRGVWTDEAVALLGRVPDCEIAALVGVTADAVAHRRRSLGIPLYTRGRSRRG
jgi:hypothetical protein